MKDGTRKRMIPLFGGSSLLVIFGVLCLTVLAVLSLETALAQQRLSESAIQAITDYHAADLEAERIFARLRSGEAVETVVQSGDRYAFACSVSARQTLQVELQKGTADWRILRWQLVAEEDLAWEDQLPVWKEE